MGKVSVGKGGVECGRHKGVRVSSRSRGRPRGKGAGARVSLSLPPLFVPRSSRAGTEPLAFAAHHLEALVFVSRLWPLVVVGTRGCGGDRWGAAPRNARRPILIFGCGRVPLESLLARERPRRLKCVCVCVCVHDALVACGSSHCPPTVLSCHFPLLPTRTIARRVEWVGSSWIPWGCVCVVDHTHTVTKSFARFPPTLFSFFASLGQGPPNHEHCGCVLCTK